MESKKRSVDEGCSGDCGLSTKLVAVRKADIPEYLHQSEFYQSLDDGNEEVLVPQNCIKLDDRIKSGDDLNWLLLSLRFWIAEPIITSVVEYTFTAPFEEVEPIIVAFYPDFPALRKIKPIRFAQKSMELAIESGNICIVKYLARAGHSWPEDAIQCVLEKGNLNMLKVALQSGCILRGNECNSAAFNGNFQCLKYLREELHCAWDENTTLSAVIAGSAECLRYAHENGCPWYDSPTDGSKNLCNIAAVTNNVACLKYAHRHGVPLLPSLITIAVEHAANTDCIQYAHEQGLAWTNGLYQLAVVRDNLHVIQYLHDHDCPWDGPEDCTTAARFGRLNSLKLLHELGCPWDHNTCYWAAMRNDNNMVLYLLRNGGPVSSRMFYLKPSETFADIVQCFVERGLSWSLTPNAILDCVENGNAAGLELLVKNGCPWHPRTIPDIIVNKNFEMFQWVHELGAPWQEDTCWLVAQVGLIDWLEYAHTHGAVISPDTCEWLRQINTWSSKLLKCFQYAHQNGGCAADRDYAELEVRPGQYGLLSYLKAQGCVV